MPFRNPEQKRLDALGEYNIMDTLAEADFDSITALAAQICGTPISLISLVDDRRQWFKSAFGLDVRETPKDQSFCAHAIINSAELFVVPDSREDERFSTNPLVTGDPHIVFYAGMPLVDDNGHALGSLCVIDNKKKELDETQIGALRNLARLTISLMQFRRRNRGLLEMVTMLEERTSDLEDRVRIMRDFGGATD